MIVLLRRQGNPSDSIEDDSVQEMLETHARVVVRAGESKEIH